MDSNRERLSHHFHGENFHIKTGNRLNIHFDFDNLHPALGLTAAAGCCLTGAHKNPGKRSEQRQSTRSVNCALCTRHVSNV